MASWRPPSDDELAAGGPESPPKRFPGGRWGSRITLVRTLSVALLTALGWCTSNHLGLL